MKKFLLAAFFGSCAMAMMAENTISVNAANGAPGETVTITLDMSTPGVTDVCAFQCDVVLPDGVSLANPENLVLSSRKADHVIASNLLDGNKYRLLCYSMTNAVLTGTSGDIASFDVIAPSTAESYSFIVENVEIVSLAEIKALVASGVGGDLTVEETGDVVGDLNGDTYVTTDDVVILRNLILTGSYDASADLNSDSYVTVDDMVILNSIVLK